MSALTLLANDHPFDEVFHDFFAHFWLNITNNSSNVVFQLLSRLGTINIDSPLRASTQENVQRREITRSRRPIHVPIL